MSERRHYSGPDLATLLRRVDDELGSHAVIIKADRVRNGGMAGFFTREHYEVVASTPEIEVTTSPSELEPRRDDVVEIDDEPIVGGSRPPAASAPLPAPLPRPRPPASLSAARTINTPVAPSTTTPAPVSAGSAASTADAVGGNPAAGRSIQAALLDRADQVSTEELLNRAAELTTAERGNESFRSILGRAVADVPERPADSQIAGNGRPGPQQADPGPTGVEEPIIGLRPEPVRPGETVIEPMPQRQPNPETGSPSDRVDPRFAAAQRRESQPSDGQPGSWTSPAHRPPDGQPGSWTSPAHHPPDGQPGSWASPPEHPSAWPPRAGPPPWASSWGPGWVPWTVDGWSMPPQPVGVPMTSHHCRCAGCSQTVPTPAIESAVLVNSTAEGCHPAHSRLPVAGARYSQDVSVSPWELRREIDEAIRLRLDEILRVVRGSVADELCDCREELADRPPVGYRESTFDRPPPPDRRGSERQGTARRQPVDPDSGKAQGRYRSDRSDDRQPGPHGRDRW